MPDHHHIDPHGFQVLRGVDQSLSLAHRRARGRHIHGVRRESFLRELEGDPGSGGGLEEEVDDGLAAERGHLLDGALAHFLEWLGGIEDQLDLFGAERLEADEVLAQARDHQPARTSSTASRPSTSETRTSTRSFGVVLTVVPTMSAWMGSSRPPRSMRTQSRIRRGRPKSANSSRAARTVRPVYRTSSTMTTVLPSTSGSRVSPTTGRGPMVCRSSR